MTPKTHDSRSSDDVYVKDLEEGSKFGYCAGCGTSAKFIITKDVHSRRGIGLVFSEAMCIDPGNGYTILEKYQFSHSMRIRRVIMINC